MARKLIEVEEKKESKKKEKKKVDFEKIKQTLKEPQGTIEMLADGIGDILDSDNKSKSKSKKTKKSKKTTSKETSSLSKLLKLFLNR